MAVDWSDPCARYAALRDAFYNLLTAGSGAETLIRTRGPEGEQEVRYGKHDLAILQTEMNAAKVACDLSNGINTTGRYAIRAGAPRRCL